MGIWVGEVEVRVEVDVEVDVEVEVEVDVKRWDVDVDRCIYLPTVTHEL